MMPMNKTQTILIVDDTPSNLAVVVNLFEGRDYRVSIARDGEEGIQRAQLLQPDIILLDVMMPGVDGFETCRRLKAGADTRGIPVIFMTSLASSEHKLLGFQAGAVDYVTKPLQFDEVIARVDTHLKLNAAQKKLAEQNEELERRVAERTIELNVSNLQLRAEIEERIWAQEKLAAREREFRTLVENAPDDIARHNRQGRYFYINPQHQKTLGMPISEVTGKTPLELFPGNPDVATYQALMLEVMETGRTTGYEATLPDEGEGPRCHSIMLVAERDAEGEVIGVLAIGRDVTERKRAERELHEQEQAIRAVVENSPDTIIRYDSQCRRIYLNPEMEKIFGQPIEQLLGTSPLESTSLPDHYLATIKKTFETGSEQRMEASFRDTRGTARWVDLRLAPEFGADGKVATVLAIGRDITERKHLEQAILIREAELRSVTDSSPYSIIRYDLDGRMTYINAPLLGYFGLPHAELVGKLPREVWPDGRFAEIERGLANVRETEQSVVVEFSETTADGEVIYHQVTIVPERGASGEIAGIIAFGLDITERKRAERDRLLLNAAVNASTEAAFLQNASGRFVYVNEEACRSLGYSREVLLTMCPLDINPDLTPEFYRMLLDDLFISSPQYNPMESHHRRKDGSIFPVEVSASPIIMEGKSYCLTLVRDITGRKETERRLHEKTQAILAVVENSPDTIIRYDSQCRRIYLNPEMAKVFGQPREQLLGTSPSEFSPLPELYLATIKKALETGSEQRMESLFREAEGETRWVDLRLAPEFDADGKVATVLAIGRDITVRKQMEQALQEREQRYREIFDNAIDGMYLLEVTEDGRFRNIDINPALAAATGIPRAAMIGKFVDETVDAETGQLVVEKYRRCVAAGTTIQESLELDLPSGKRYFDSIITPIEFGGRIHRLLGISRDITEIKRIELDLKESRTQLRGLTAQREQAREEERKHIAREIHDELGQILSGIKLNISVLNHKFAADSMQLRDLWKETFILTDRSLEVVRNVASALRPAVLDMGIDSALEWLTERFGTNTGIQCELRIADDELQLEERSAIALFRIVQESLTNVARHAKADKVVVMLGKEANDYVLKIRDNGIGFDAGTAKANSFGLVGIRERVLILGGKVSINSRPGEGTEIVVRIPAHEIQEEL